MIITDGRANVSLKESNDVPLDDDAEVSKAALREEVLDMARRSNAEGFSMLVIDTEKQFLTTGFAQEIAKAGGGRHYYLPNATDKAIAAAASRAMAAVKEG